MNDPSVDDPPVKLVNLTPHEVVLETDSGVLRLPPEGVRPEVTMDTSDVGQLKLAGGFTISVSEVRHGEVKGLPDPQDGVYLIVARLVAQAASDRSDLVFPDDFARDTDGNIIAARRLGRIAR